MFQKKGWELAEADWHHFLDWLDADRERAAAHYQELHRRLTAFFRNRGCLDAEDLADETCNRGIRQLPKLQDRFEGEPEPYLYTIAQHLFLEYTKERQRLVSLPEPESLAWLAAPSNEEQEQESECLANCLQQLPAKQRELILMYYQDEKRSKIEHRKLLAEELKVSATALRLRALRLREVLERCLENCLKSKKMP
jgi:RNA polymerase sigma factor (sigma-70 family)